MTALRKSIALAALLVGTSLFASNAFAQLRLTGGEEVPPNHSEAVGSCSIRVDADGNVTGTVSAPTLKQPRAALIQLGAPGQAGPPIITLEGGDEGTWSVPDGARLTPEQLQAYQAGELYVNIHTDAYPTGELRAQLRP
jgi:hypothetical protein